MAETEPIPTSAQQQVNLALEGINRTRIIRKDSTEAITKPDYERETQSLFGILYDLPEEVRCLTVKIEIPPCPQEPKLEIDFLNRNLRNLVAPLANSASDFAETVTVSFTIKTPQMPEKLKSLHFGSYARQLSEEVVETVIYGARGSIDLLEINPIGEPKSSPGRNFRTLYFPVPLRFVRSITLEKEEKPLTPCFERDTNGSLIAHEVNYF